MSKEGDELVVEFFLPQVGGCDWVRVAGNASREGVGATELTELYAIMFCVVVLQCMHVDATCVAQDL